MVMIAIVAYASTPQQVESTIARGPVARDFG